MALNEVSFTISQDDSVAAQQLHFRRSLSVRPYLVALLSGGAGLAAVILVADGHIDPWGFVFALFCGAGFLVGLVLLSWLTLPSRTRRTWRQRKIPRDVELTWDGESLTIKSQRGYGKFAWADFYRWSADKKSLLLYVDRRLFYLLPLRAFPSGAEESFKTFLSEAGIQRR